MMKEVLTIWKNSNCCSWNWSDCERLQTQLALDPPSLWRNPHIFTGYPLVAEPRGSVERCSDFSLKNRWLPTHIAQERDIKHNKLLTYWLQFNSQLLSHQPYAN